MEQLYGIFLYAVFLLTMGGIYAVLTLGLNIQWGFTGLFNAGVAGFFAIGAYTTAIVSTVASERHLGGFGLPAGAGMVAAMIASAIIAWGVGRICIRLRADYLAIATLGIAEIFRLVLKNEVWATNGPRGISLIPKPFEHLAQPWNHVGMLPAGLRGGRRALRPARTGAAFPLGTGDGRNPRERGGGARGGKGRRAPAHRSLRPWRRPHGPRRGADGAPHQVHRAERGGADLRHLPGLGHARCRGLREQSGARSSAPS